MINFIIYNAVGRIVRSGTCQDQLLAQQVIDEDERVLIGDCQLNTDYIHQGEVALRPTQQTTLNKTTIAADGVDNMTISASPAGVFTATNVITKETATGAISGTDAFYTTIPGTYKIKIEAWPFLDFETTIEAI